jgi:hypothetical protein
LFSVILDPKDEEIADSGNPKERARLNHRRLDQQPASMTTLYDIFHKKYLEDARQRLQAYKESSNIQNSKIATVYLMWLEGGCYKFAEDLQNSCYKPDNVNVTAAAYTPRSKLTCDYMEDFVRQQSPPGTNGENVLVVPLSDGQRKDLEAKFAIRDDSPYQTQVIMMVLSDYHFASVLSTNDNVVTYWREPDQWIFPQGCRCTDSGNQ